MKKIKIGIVGAGFNGQISFIQNFHKNKKCEILGLAEARDKLRIKVGKKFKIKKLYKNHLEMIKDIKYFDGIAIITRREMIGPISYEFLKHGKIILSEKPMAGNLIQSKKLLEISKNSPKWLVGPGTINTNPLGGIFGISLMAIFCFLYFLGFCKKNQSLK